MLFIRNF